MTKAEAYERAAVCYRPDDVSSLLMRALRCIQLARRTFRDEIQGLTANN